MRFTLDLSIERRGITIVKAFSQRNLLEKHINSVHKGVKNHKCTICDKAFSESGSVRNHIKTVHRGERNYKCPICDQVFSEGHSVKNHIRNVHGGAKKPNLRAHEADVFSKEPTRIRVSDIK